MMCRVGDVCASRWSRAAAFGIWCCRPSDSYPSVGVPYPTLPAYPVSTYPLVTAPSMYPPLSSYPSATYPPSSGLATGYVAFSDAPSQPEQGAPAPGLTQLLDRVIAAQCSDDVIVALSELSVNPELLYVQLTGVGGRPYVPLRTDGSVVFASSVIERGAGMCVCVCVAGVSEAASSRLWQRALHFVSARPRYGPRTWLARWGKHWRCGRPDYTSPTPSLCCKSPIPLCCKSSTPSLCCNFPRAFFKTLCTTRGQT